jgi:hypothetical protein
LAASARIASPTAPRGTMELKLIGGIREMVLRYDGFILDLWGVIR